MTQVSESWLSILEVHLETTQRRPDFCERIMRVARAMLLTADPLSRTVTPGRWELARAAGVHALSVPRYLRAIRAAGLLGIVALGRSADKCPASSEDFTRFPRPDEHRHGDRSVYVLCLPMDVEETLVEYTAEELERMERKCKLDLFMARFKEAVDISATPSPSTGKRVNPRSIREWATPMLKSHFEAATRETAKIMAARTDLSWPGNATTSASDEATTRHNELQAARKVKFLAPALRDVRDTTLASTFRPYFRSGWTANDIKHALDHMPDGRLWPHDGFRGLAHPVIGVKVRLKPWRLGGEPIYSKSQRVVRNAEEARDRAIAVSQRKTTAPPVARGSFGQGVAMLRAALRLGRAMPTGSCL